MVGVGPQGSQFDNEVESDGYPTRYERQVWSDHKPLEDVTCPVCGMQKQTVRFIGSDLRYMLAAATARPEGLLVAWVAGKECK